MDSTSMNKVGHSEWIPSEAQFTVEILKILHHAPTLPHFEATKQLLPGLVQIVTYSINLKMMS